MKNNKQFLMIMLLLLGIVLVTVGTTYAFFTYSKDGTKTVTLSSSNAVKLHYQEDSLKKINLTNAFAMDDDTGKQQEYFEFTITSETSTFEVPYIVAARVQTEEANKIPEGYISVYLTEVVSGVEQPVLSTTYDQLTDISKNNHIEQELFRRTVEANTSNYEKVYRLRMWINETADYTPVEVGGVQTYPMQNKEFAFTVNVYTEAEIVQGCTVAFSVATQAGSTLAMGDEVYLDSEHFIVVSSDNDATVLLPKHNIVIYGYATPVGSVDDLQFYIDDGTTSFFDGMYKSYVPFMSSGVQQYITESISDYSNHPSAYLSTADSEPEFQASTSLVNNPIYCSNYLERGFLTPSAYEYGDIECNGSYYSADWSVIDAYYEPRYSNYVSGWSNFSGRTYKTDGDLGVNGYRGELATSDNYSVAYYVERYQNAMTAKGATINNARLLTYDEATTLANNNVTMVEHNNETFWLGTLSDSYYADVVDGSGVSSQWATSSSAGVRPVLEVPTCSIGE